MKRSRHRRPRSRMVALLALVTVVVAILAAWQVDWERLALPERESLRGRTPASEAYVTNDVVNLRSGPATSYQILDVLAEETSVTVTGDSRQGFLPVSFNGQDAWIAADYLTPASAGQAVAAVREISDDVVTRSGLMETANAAPAVVEETWQAEPEPEVQPEYVAVDVPDEVTEPIAEPSVPEGERWVEVDRTTALVTLHHGDTIVATYQGKIGRDPSADGYYATAVGTYHVFSMNKELTETPFVEGVFLTDWVGFDPERSNGFHSPVRDAAGNVVNTQGTTTLGCVRLDEQAAQSMYDFAFIGMRVEVHD